MTKNEEQWAHNAKTDISEDSLRLILKSFAIHLHSSWYNRYNHEEIDVLINKWINHADN